MNVANVLIFNKNEIQIIEQQPPCCSGECVARTLLEIVTIVAKAFFTAVIVAGCVIAWPVALGTFVIVVIASICSDAVSDDVGFICRDYFRWMIDIDTCRFCGVLCWDASLIGSEPDTLAFKQEMVLVPKDVNSVSGVHGEFDKTLAAAEGKYLQVNPEKRKSIDEIIEPYSKFERGIAHFAEHWPDKDFTTPGLKGQVVWGWTNKIQAYHGAANRVHMDEAVRYFNVLLNVLDEYRKLESDTDRYREHLDGVMKEILTSLDSCPINQIAALRGILCDTLLQHSGLAKGRSFADLHFAAGICKYQECLVRQAAAKHIREVTGTEYVNAAMKVNKENVELEFVVKKELGISNATAKAHFFEDDNRHVVAATKRTFVQEYRPLQYLMSNLTESNPETRLTAAFHRAICAWFNEQGFDTEDRDRKLLMHPDVAAGFDYQFNPRAVLYFMIKNNLLTE